MNFLEAKNVHFVGLGGIGVSAIARFFVDQGARVSGSDRADFDQAEDLRKRGIAVSIKHDAGNVPPETEVVVYSSAVPMDNPELVLAKDKGIPLVEYVEALAFIMESKYGIGVSGTNGKTTTTAMLGKILEEAEFDPLVIVGGKVPGWDANLRLPQRSDLRSSEGRTFVVEACEYRRHFLKLSPKVIVLTNIEAEHLDYFKDLNDIKSAFSEYVEKLPAGGTLVYNEDDENVAAVSRSTKARLVSYSLMTKTKADLIGSKIRYENGAQYFDMKWNGEPLGTFSIGVPGKFNVYNALAASAAALSLGATPVHVRHALDDFSGTWRRFEKKGMIENTLIISDYAHHPAGVAATIKAAKELYPKKKILVVFQPHQKDRTKKLLHEFAEALAEAKALVLSEIYEVAGREETGNDISSKDLARETEMTSNIPAMFGGNTQETEKLVRKILPKYDIVIFMGAGDIYKIADNLLKK